VTAARHLPAGLALAALLTAAGCGLLFPSPGPGFRQYPLKGVGFLEAESLVRDVTARVFTERFGGGFTIEWDEDQANLLISPVYEPTRRLRMFLHLLPDADGTVVEMLALVEHLDDGSAPGALWTRPMQDVPFEETLYEEFILEAMRRKEPAPVGPSS
jgi:hypothetical protein